MAERDRRHALARPPARSRTAGAAAPRSVTPPPQGLSRGKLARSTSSVRTPSRASRCAVSEPDGPAPTTMTSKRSTPGAYDLGMGDSSVRVEDAGDLRVRQAMIARPKTVSRYASVGEARILFENPKNRLLLVDDDGIYSGPPDARGRAGERAGRGADPVRTSAATARRSARTTASPMRSPLASESSTTGSSWSARMAGSRGCCASTSATATSAWTCADDGRPPQRADAGRLPAAHRLHPSRRASPLVHEDGRRITYGELEERCHRLANALRDRGLQHGDRVAVLSPNAPAILEAHYAVPLAGGVLVAINTRLAPPEIDHILRHSGARTLIVDHALAPLVDAARPQRHRRRALRRQRARGRPLRAADRLRLARAARVVARARGGADLDQLHLGHDGRAEGRRLHPSRRLPERALRGHRRRPHARERVPLDAADVPLQRLVLPVGRDGRRRAPRDRALGRLRAASGS